MGRGCTEPQEQEEGHRHGAGRFGEGHLEDATANLRDLVIC